MHSALRRFLIMLYPRAWRDRYGAEFEVLLEDTGGSRPVVFDVIREGLLMRAETRELRSLAAFCLAGVVIAGVIAIRLPDRYISEAVAEVRMPVGSAPQTGIDAIIRAEGVTISRGSLARLVTELDLYPSERARMPLEDVVARMTTRDLAIRIASRSKASPDVAFAVRFIDTDPARAKRVTALVTANLTSALQAQANVVSLLDPPSMRGGPVSPNRAVILTIGLMAGLISGISLVVLRRLRTNRATAARRT